MLYAQVGRIEDARAMYEKGFGKWPEAMKTVRFYMNYFPFKDHEVAKQIAAGYVKAGLGGAPSDFYRISEANRLGEKELKTLFFDRTVTGFEIGSGKQWWIERSDDGKATTRDGDKTDSGKSWVEGDMLCDQWDNLYEGLRDCWVVYRNPEGTPQTQDEYLGAPGYGLYPFSVVE